MSTDAINSNAITVKTGVNFSPQVGASSLSVTYGLPINIGETPVNAHVIGPRDAICNGPEEGYTEEQFQTALELASKPIADKVQAAKARGFIGAEATKKLMDAALNADS